MKNPLKSPKLFICDYCNYKCSNKKDYNKHLATAKHKMLTNANKKIPKNPQMNSGNKWVCDCGKIYKQQPSLIRHKKTCSVVINNEPNNEDSNLILKIAEQQEEINRLKVKQKEEELEFKNREIEIYKDALKEMSKSSSVSIAGNQINNTTNNFNLNFFLNDTCKDALNLTDFIDSLRVQLEDLEYTTDNGHIKGITNIFRTALCNMEETKRPVHCTDLKREVLYIKDNDEWYKDDNKELMKCAVIKVVDKNISNQMEWLDNHPDVLTPGSKDSNRYVKMMDASLGKGDEPEQHKIMKNIMKDVIIDKENN
jgi:hypothetical protein